MEMMIIVIKRRQFSKFRDIWIIRKKMKEFGYFFPDKSDNKFILSGLVGALAEGNVK